jgi:AcrR family transcriptional regulator
MAQARGGKSAAAAAPPRGRPRDAAIDEAIIRVTRERLARDGYSRLTLGDIAAAAKVTRPTLYRRWSSKFELVVDALDYGFRKQRDSYTVDIAELAPRDAFVEAIRRLDPAYFNPDAIVLMGNFAGETAHTPELLEILRKHAVQPRVALMEQTLRQLQKRRAVRAGIDPHMVAIICFGSYFAAFYAKEPKRKLAERIGDTIWPAIAITPRRRSA